MATSLTNKILRKEYNDLFDSCIIQESRMKEIEQLIEKFLELEPRYRSVADLLGMPWYIIAIIHRLECGSDFKLHLHNGDPLTAKTTHVPAGRPLKGNPPFTWEQSAKDALTLMQFSAWKDWTIAGTCYKIETYNGMGYRKHGIYSPYLWGSSNHYKQGKYVQDGVWSDVAVSKQIGAAILLRRLKEKKLIEFQEDKTRVESQINNVLYAPNTYNKSAEILQKFLNSVGATLLVDGKAGKMTSDAFHKFSGYYLKGDPRG